MFYILINNYHISISSQQNLSNKIVKNKLQLDYLECSVFMCRILISLLTLLYLILIRKLVKNLTNYIKYLKNKFLKYTS
jgi:hypothetical protein